MTRRQRRWPAPAVTSSSTSRHAEPRDPADVRRTLVRLLPEWTADRGSVHLVYPGSRNLSARVAAIDGLAVRTRTESFRLVYCRKPCDCLV